MHKLKTINQLLPLLKSVVCSVKPRAILDHALAGSGLLFCFALLLLPKPLQAFPNTLAEITAETAPWLVVGTGAVNDSTTPEGVFNKGVGDAFLISNFEVGANKAPVPANGTDGNPDYGPDLQFTSNIPYVPGVNINAGPVMGGGPVVGVLPTEQVITYDGNIAITHTNTSGSEVGSFNTSNAGIFAKNKSDLSAAEIAAGATGVSDAVPAGIVCAGPAAATNAGCIAGDSNSYFNDEQWPNPINDPDEGSPASANVLSPGTGITGNYDFSDLRTALDTALSGASGHFVGIPNLAPAAPLDCLLEINNNDVYIDVCKDDPGSGMTASTIDLTDYAGQISGDDVTTPTNLYVKLNDGLNVIDFATGSNNGNALLLNNANFIIDGSENASAIFRVPDGVKFNLSQSNILIGDMGIMNMNVMFFSETPGSDHNPIFEFNNSLLNGVAFWALGDGTSINVNNSQGCSQFISDKVNFQNTRYSNCSFKAQGTTVVSVPEPGAIFLMLSGLLVAGVCRKRA